MATARPFLKWAGGKAQLLGDYAPLFPTLGPLATYHEPFIGAGAVFFHLRTERRVPGRAVLSDLNEHLMAAWVSVRDEPLLLAARLGELETRHSSDEYYAVRERYNTERLAPLERAALLIYLNKAGFNGLYRVNRTGAFNVPVGKQAGGVFMPTSEHLVECSKALAGVELLHSPFAAVLDRAKPGDFVYFDPPYVPVSPTSSFTDYGADGFDTQQQDLLRDVFVHLDHRGCKVMLSNSGNLELLRLYGGYDITTVLARRSINSKTDSRGPVTEVVIRNFT